MTRGVRIAARYGEIEVLGYEGPWRIELYTPHDAAGAVRERAMCASADDVSGRHSIGRDYDSRCGCCWLNITHTASRHAADVGASSHGR